MQIGLLGLACIASSFSIGIHTAGDVQPFTLIEAGSTNLSGDMDDNGAVDIQDVIIILEIVQGYREADATARSADPNGDGRITVDDALRILSNIHY